MASIQSLQYISDPEAYSPTEQCFYCGNPLCGEKFVMWHGNDEKGQEIWMHPKCAVRLSIHLSEDSGL